MPRLIFGVFLLLLLAHALQAQSSLLPKNQAAKSFVALLDSAPRISDSTEFQAYLEATRQFGLSQEFPLVQSFCLEAEGRWYARKKNLARAVELGVNALELIPPTTDPNREFDLIEQIEIWSEDLPNREAPIAYFQQKVQQTGTSPNLVRAILWESIGHLYYTLNEPDSIGKYYTLAYNDLMAIGEKDQASHTLINNFSYLIKQGEFEEVLNQLLDGKATLLRLEEWENTSIILGNIGFTYRRMGEYEKALQAFEEARDLLLEKQTSEEELEEALMHVYHEIGNFYREFKYLDLAYENLNKVHTFFAEGHPGRNLAAAKSDLGYVFLERQEPDRARQLFQEAFDIYRSIGEDDPFPAHINLNMGMLLMQQDSLIKAESFLLNALDAAQKSEQGPSEMEACRLLGELNRKLGKPESAERYLNQAKLISQEVNIPAQKVRLLLLESEILADKKDYEGALRAQNALRAFRDSIRPDELDIRLAESNARFENNALQTTINEMKPRIIQNGNDIAVLEQAKKQLQLYILIAGILIVTLIVIALLLVRQSRYRKRTNETLAQQKEEIEWLMKEFSHRIKNSLQLLTSSVSMRVMQMDAGSEKEVASRILSQIETMASINKSLDLSNKQSDNQLFDCAEMITEILQSMGSSYSDSSHPVKLKLYLDQLHLSSKLSESLALLVFEICANAFKHAFTAVENPVIQVDLHPQQDGWWELVIRDNGPGFPDGFEPGQSRSMGWKLMGFLCKELHGKLSIEAGPGAAVRVLFPENPRK